jgi:predicted metal-dependent hydrolase
MEHTPRLRHRIELTRNKHSRAVCRGNTIVIRLAKNLSPSQQQEHVTSLLRRMTALVLLDRRKTNVDPFRPLLEGASSTMITLGTGRRVRFQLRAGTKTRVQRQARGWLVTVSPRVRRRQLHRLLWNCLATDERERLTALVHSLNAQTYDTPISRVKVQFATTQWGSCSSRGVIMLNIALVCLPPALMRYVIVHELAHRLVPDHSMRFWDTVARVLPTYQRWVEALRDYRLPST